LAIAGLGLGVICGKKPLAGSCGGLACIRGAGCAGCSRKAYDKENQP
jgi:hypothetical protein